MRRIQLFIKNLDICIFCTNLSRYKFLNCCFYFCCFCGLCLGVISAGDSLIYARYLGEINIYEVVFSGQSVMVIFWSRLSLVFACTVIVWIFSLHRCCLPLSFLFLTFRGFMLGANLASAFALYGMSGLIVGVFLSLPVNILLIVMHSIMCCYSFKTACDKQPFGKAMIQSSCVCFCVQIFVCLFEILAIQVLVLPLIYIL